jgi:tRNA A37 methylthiotransferase MiaB
VKNPSQSAMETLIHKGKDAGKPLVIAGCVPQGSKDLKDLEGVSVVGVQQIDRVVEVVEETLKGHEVRLLKRSSLPSLDLPKVRKNKYVEIVPINVGCLGACTYCKTKHARGHLGSYPVLSLVSCFCFDILFAYGHCPILNRVAYLFILTPVLDFTQKKDSYPNFCFLVETCFSECRQ